LPRLDSLRGIAALMVAGFHTLVAGGTPLEQKIMLGLGFLFDPRIGVCIFFVLSGLVLRHVVAAAWARHAGAFFTLLPAPFVPALSRLRGLITLLSAALLLDHHARTRRALDRAWLA
jgi:peptidoglycan/LPS O-acetylase OafA/YrhL